MQDGIQTVAEATNTGELLNKAEKDAAEREEKMARHRAMLASSSLKMAAAKKAGGDGEAPKHPVQSSTSFKGDVQETTGDAGKERLRASRSVSTLQGCDEVVL